MNQLLSALFALVIGATALYYALPMLVDAQMQPAQNDAGNQIAILQAATISYMRDNPGNFLSAATAANPIFLKPSDFPTAYLPATFQDFNVFGQSHMVSIIPNAAGQYEALIYTYDGDTMPDGVALRVAQAGPPNSVVYIPSDPLYPNDVTGAAGGEAIPLAPFMVKATHPMTAGHIGAHVLPAAYTAEAPFLNRYNTGNPDDNTMHTAIYMDGQEIDMGTGASATSGGGNINMASGNINMAGGNVSAANLITTNQVNSTQKILTPTLVDLNDSTYHVTPAGTSNIGSLIVTGNVTVDGTSTATTYLHLSDARLKKNIRDIDNPLSIVERLQGRKFDWKQNGKPDIGFVAQEVQRVLPEAVVTSPEGHLAVKYDVLTAPLVEAVKAQAEQIDRLDDAVSEKSAEIDQLKNVVAHLEKGNR